MGVNIIMNDKDTLIEVECEKDQSKTKSVAIYIRCAKDADSHKLQAYLKALVERKRDWQFTKTFIDVGYSGYNINRPALKELLAECEAGKVNVIVAKNFENLSRNTSDLIQLYDFLRRRKIAFYHCGKGLLDLISVDQSDDRTHEMLQRQMELIRLSIKSRGRNSEHHAK